jgi:hypothetical protein
MRNGPRIPWLALALLGAALMAVCLAWAAESFPLLLPSCPLKTALGIPCATCGGTRCALALWKGHFREAFHWHPVLACLGLVSPLAALWDLRRAWRGEAYPPLPETWQARTAAALLLVGTWILQVARGL